MGSQAGVVIITHASHLYYKCCMWAEFSVDLNLTSRVFAGDSSPIKRCTTHAVLAFCIVSQLLGLLNMKYEMK